MTRQFCRQKLDKNGHILGKIRHCVVVLKVVFSFLLVVFVGLAGEW